MILGQQLRATPCVSGLLHDLFFNNSGRKVPPELVPNLLTKFAPIKLCRFLAGKAVLEAPEQQDMRGRE